MVVPWSVGDVQTIESVEPRSEQFLSLRNGHVRSNEGFHVEVVVSVASIVCADLESRSSEVIVTIGTSVDEASALSMYN